MVDVYYKIQVAQSTWIFLPNYLPYIWWRQTKNNGWFISENNFKIAFKLIFFSNSMKWFVQCLKISEAVISQTSHFSHFNCQWAQYHFPKGKSSFKSVAGLLHSYLLGGLGYFLHQTPIFYNCALESVSCLPFPVVLLFLFRFLSFSLFLYFLFRGFPAKDFLAVKKEQNNSAQFAVVDW